MFFRNCKFDGNYYPHIVDDVIARGSMHDWDVMGISALHCEETRKSIKQIVNNYKNDPYAQRQAAWKKFIDLIEKEYPL